MPRLNDLTNLANVANAASNLQEVAETNKRYSGNKTIGKQFKLSWVITLSWLLSCIILSVVLALLGVAGYVIGALDLVLSIVTLIPGVIIYVKVTNAGLSARQLIMLNEGYGQFVIRNEGVYYVDYTKSISKDEAAQLVYDYCIENKEISDIRVYNLLDIKHIKSKRYKGKPLDVIGFTYELLKNPDKTSTRLYYVEFPIYHDNPRYNSIINMPRFVETEDDRQKDKKDLIKGFIIATVVLILILLIRPIGIIIGAILCGGLYLAWECTTNELKGHKSSHFLLRAYIILVGFVGIYFIAASIAVANGGWY